MPISEKSAASDLTIEPISGATSGLRAPLELASQALINAVPQRNAWVEVDLAQLRRNFQVIHRHKPPHVALAAVVKDEAYGHGAVPVAKIALESGADFLVVSTIHEAVTLRQNLIQAPILLLGERPSEDLPHCFHYDLRCSIGRIHTALELEQIGSRLGRPALVHLKIDTGMSRYGVRWTDALPCIEHIQHLKWVRLEGVFSHFAMSDEADKTFALEQYRRFCTVLEQMQARNITVKYRHLCNSGGFLDLPMAHFDMVRSGILALGIYPSQVCRRLPGITPVMQVKCRLAAIQNIRPGDTVGYGMRYRAQSPRRIGVLPIGYGDGFPRLRNQGWALLHGRKAPIVGSNAMDAIMVDLSDIPQAQLWDETVLVGRQPPEEISVHHVAQWGQTVSYDILSRWRARLPRLYLDNPS